MRNESNSPYRCTKDISGNEKHNIVEYLKQSHYLTLELTR